MKVEDGGCPYCYSKRGNCYGQCDERFRAQIKMMVVPLRKLQRDLARILAKHRRTHKEKR